MIEVVDVVLELTGVWTTVVTVVGEPTVKVVVTT
jgi:hypothetical protein